MEGKTMGEYIINTKSGKVKGYLRDGRIEYLGIPYAKPPVGKLRFKRAQKMEPWDGVFDAGGYGPEAVQNDEGEDKGSEDCLTMNIQRPKEGEKLPVFVYIHGGGYTTGAACVPLYNGKHFADDGLIFVSFQYRMSVLGFYDFTTYPGCEEFDSNCGLSDQIMAMQWIHDNIAAFGGDPENVTINGESAGGATVVNMLAMPAVKGLFQKAIAQSSLPNCVCTHETARENMNLYLEGMGMTENDIPKLKTMDPFELLRGVEYIAEHHQYRNPGMFLPGPVIDDLLPERPIDAIRGGSAKDVKLIIGTNLQEGAYPFISFATDYAFQMPSVKVAEAQRTYTKDVWMYRYEYITKSGWETGWLASHAFELPLSFANMDFHFSRFVFKDEPEETIKKLIEEIHGSWVRFAKTGDPNPEWIRFAGYDSPVRIFDRESKTVRLDRSELMQVWDDMRFYEK